MKDLLMRVAIYLLVGTLPDWNNWQSVQQFARRVLHVASFVAGLTPWTKGLVAVIGTAMVLVNTDSAFRLWWNDAARNLDNENNNSQIDNGGNGNANRPILNALRNTLITLRLRANRS